MKIKKVLSLTLALILCTCSVSFAFAEGQVPDGYTPIYTAQDLDGIREDLSGKFVLMNDIDLTEYKDWEPIGTEQSAFSGKLLGNGMVIKGLKVCSTINSTNRNSSGLFAFTNGATIKDLCVVDADIKILIETTCFSSVGIISGNSRHSQFINCSTSGNILARINGTCSVGGISGETIADSAIEKCESSVNITVDGKSELYVGGITGSSNSKISVCHNSGNITVDNSYSINKESDIICIGGICGNMFLNEINNCYNTGNIAINCVSDNSCVGGIGGSTFSLASCYSVGEITFCNQPPTITTGEIAGNVVYSFNGIGLSENVKSTVENCYCLNSNYKILGNMLPEQIINACTLSEEAMKKQESFVGFDFEIIWEMEENSYPMFRESAKSSSDNGIISAKIIYVPLKNRIVFGYGAPALPNGIVVKLTYLDGTVKKAVIRKTENGFFVNDEKVTGGFIASVNTYGILTDTLFLNDGQIKMEYRYLVIPPIITVIRWLIHR